ncbi:MAG: portal protein [Aestuariivirga sp.]
MDIERLTKELKRHVKSMGGNDATRADLFDRYMGEPYPGDSGHGKSAQGSGATRSQFVSSAPWDLVSTIHVEVMDLLTSDGRLAQFAPVGPDDEELAEQETDVVEHIIFSQNRGWEMLSNWTLSALIEQVSYGRAGWEDKEEVRIDDYQGRTLDELVMMINEYEAAGEEYEFIEQVENEDGTFDVTVRCVKKEKVYKVTTFPQSEFRLSGDWPSITLDGVPFCGWLRDDWTMNDLVAFGFDEESIKAIDLAEDDIGDDSRKAGKFHDEQDEDEDHYAVGEFYIRMSEKDGKPSSVWQVWASKDGAKVLKWKSGEDAIKEVDDHPFVALTPFMIPHRHAGRSATELAKDVGDVSTVLWRQTLDNIYRTGNARPVVGPLAGDQLFDDLMAPEPGAALRTQSMDDLRWDSPPNVTGATLPLIEMMKAELEARTGVTRYNQGLDASSLNKTAAGTKMIMSASQKRVLAIVRTFKETGIRALYQKVHRDLRRGPGKAMTLRLRGKWVEVDPRAWRKREDVIVSGTNDKDVKAQGLQVIASLQEKLLASQMPRMAEMITPKEIYATAEQIMAGYGFKSISQFIKDPDQLPPPQPAPPPPPDPMLMAAETDRMNAQANAELKSEELDIKRQEILLKFKELSVKEADNVGKFENAAEANDIKRDTEAARDDRERESTAMQFAETISAQEQAAIGAKDTDPVIEDAVSE